MKPSMILVFVMRILVVVFLVISAQILWRGHHLPGGGFIGGLVAGSILALAGWTMGVERARRLLVISPVTLIFAGLGVALASGIPGLISGGAVFQGIWISVPWLEKLGTPLVFDVGVYLVVIGFCVAFSWGLLEAAEKEAR